MSVIGPGLKRAVWQDGDGREGKPVHYRYSCPAGCGFFVTDESERVAKKKAEAHQCTAGWCAIPMTPARVALLGRPHIPEPTKEDRQRWALLRERNERRRRQ